MTNEKTSSQPTDSLSKALLSAIRDSGKSCYAISSETGIDASMLSRFVNGQRSLTLETASKLADAFGLELLPRSTFSTGSKKA